MAATITRLRTKRDRLRHAEADHLRQLVMDFAATHRVPDRAVTQLVAAIDRETATSNEWPFVMISPEAHAAVVEWLFANSKRPIVAVRLWSKLFMHLRRDTGEVALSRDELAQLVGTEPRNVSRIMTELEGAGAIIRQRDGKTVRYFMNPVVGTHLPHAARVKAQAAAPIFRLVPLATD